MSKIHRGRILHMSKAVLVMIISVLIRKCFECDFGYFISTYVRIYETTHGHILYLKVTRIRDMAL